MSTSINSDAARCVGIHAVRDLLGSEILCSAGVEYDLHFLGKEHRVEVGSLQIISGIYGI
jgi:hypothetical protein